MGRLRGPFRSCCFPTNQGVGAQTAGPSGLKSGPTATPPSTVTVAVGPPCEPVEKTHSPVLRGSPAQTYSRPLAEMEAVVLPLAAVGAIGPTRLGPPVQVPTICAFGTGLPLPSVNSRVTAPPEVDDGNAWRSRLVL